MNAIIVRDVVLGNVDIDCKTLAHLATVCKALYKPCAAKIRRNLKRVTHTTEKLYRRMYHVEAALDDVHDHQMRYYNWIETTGTPFWMLYNMINTPFPMSPHDMLFISVVYYWYQKQPFLRSSFETMLRYAVGSETDCGISLQEIQVTRARWRDILFEQLKRLRFERLFDIQGSTEELAPDFHDMQVVRHMYQHRDDIQWKSVLDRVVACIEEIVAKVSNFDQAMEKYQMTKTRLLEKTERLIGFPDITKKYKRIGYRQYHELPFVQDILYVRQRA